jgi:hypothetical protein
MKWLIAISLFAFLWLLNSLSERVTKNKLKQVHLSLPTKLHNKPIEYRLRYPPPVNLLEVALSPEPGKKVNTWSTINNYSKYFFLRGCFYIWKHIRKERGKKEQIKVMDYENQKI